MRETSERCYDRSRMLVWDAAFESACEQSIATVCDGEAVQADRDRAWQALLVSIAPWIERWAQGSRRLSQWKLTGEDDVRTVLVAVLGRLQRNDFANLRRYRSSLRATELTEAPDPELSAVASLTRLAEVFEEPEPAPALAQGSDVDSDAPTPFRAWLITLLDYVVSDHLRGRLGWGRRDVDGAPRTKRDIGTDAARLSSVPEGAERPPITDYLTVRRLLDEVEACAAGFPAPMREAFAMWLTDASFSSIAEALELADAAAARKLVRAAQARLRKALRGRWTSLGLGAL